MPILTYTDVTKQFGPDITVLEDISFSVEPGELVLLTGQTGSGKTTLMKLLTREYRLTSGEIHFNDLPVHDLSMAKIHELRRVLGVVFQDYRLIKDSNVWENIATPMFITNKTDAEIEQRTSDLLNLIGLAHKAEHFPSQLSGGEAQRVAIARALALGPELVFADEPTGNLDPETSKGIAQLLDKINELGTTILIATHDPVLFDVFSKRRRLELAKGKLIKDTGEGKAVKRHEEAEDAAEKTEEKSDQALEKVTHAQKKPFWHKLFLFNKTATPTRTVVTTETIDLDENDKKEQKEEEKNDKHDKKDEKLEKKEDKKKDHKKESKKEEKKDKKDE